MGYTMRPARTTSNRTAVDASEMHRWQRMMTTLPAARMDKVLQIRAQLRASEYDDSRKIEATVDRMIDEAFPLSDELR